MGLTHATLKVTNALNGTSIDVDFLVDTGATLTCVPESVAVQLGYDPEECVREAVTVADGRMTEVPRIGPLEVRFDPLRSCFTEALVLGRQPLLGVIAIDALDLIVDPLSRRLRTPPDRSNRPVYPVY